MKMNLKHCVWVLAIAGSANTAVFAADREIKVEDRLDASADTLRDMMRASDKGIPQDLIDKAKCVVVMPGMKKAGFIFGAEEGRGFAVCRREGGVGLERAGRDADRRRKLRISDWRFGDGRVLLVMNDGGMKHLLSDKFTVGGDASGAAGPDWPRHQAPGRTPC